jgi:hypothetical protein
MPAIVANTSTKSSVSLRYLRISCDISLVTYKSPSGWKCGATHARERGRCRARAIAVAGRERIPGGGDRIAFMQPNLSGLTLCDLRTLRCEPLDATVDETNRFDWFLTRDAVWYRTPTPEVVRFDLSKRAITWRHAFAPTAFGLSLAVSPDERALLVAREAPPVIDLMYAPVPTPR